MLGAMRRPCPLHGAAVMASCEWCSLGDRNLAIEQIRARVHAAIRATEPGAMPFCSMRGYSWWPVWRNPRMESVRALLALRMALPRFLPLS
jgi:hypothetical protein